MNIEFRRLRQDEVEAFRTLRLRALLDSPDSFGETYDMASMRSFEEWDQYVKDGANGDDYAIFVACNGNSELIASVIGRMRSNESIVGVWTAPDYRGLRLAEQLSIKAIEWIRNNGGQSIRLSVTIGNDSARKLYERLGFRAIGEFEPLDSNPELMVEYMVLDLSNS